MNKEVVKKYKKEFDWWLNGGEILLQDQNGEWFVKQNDHWTYEGPYIINNEYAEYAKARAEGKIIEFSSREFTKPFWHKYEFTEFNKDYIYRIKPDKPKFKVGDWVTHPEIEGPFQYAIHDTCTLVKLWEPQKNELCWFWNEYDKEHMCEMHKVPMLLRFESKTNGSYAVKELDRNWFNHCEPYIGTLPTIKEESK